VKRYFKVTVKDNRDEDYFRGDDVDSLDGEAIDDNKMSGPGLLKKDDPFFVEKCQGAEKELLKLKDSF
jgi:hypothetical protein